MVDIYARGWKCLVGKSVNPTQLSMSLLAIAITAIAIWWIWQTLKEGRKAVYHSKDEKIDSS
tara:strand:- start:79 stop:264 length:186 start_codon:yes stop_codon:yes gene_type:complete